MNKHKKQSAFTLVELIVVITILAILGTIAFISLQGYSTQARDSTRISDISSMKTSLELFQLDAGKYPQPTNGVNITYSGSTVWSQGIFGETVYANVSKLDKIPKDPLTDKEYTYSVISTRNEYELGGMIEGDVIGMNNIVSKTNAGNVDATAYVSGNYNGQMTNSLSGTTCNVLSIPTIITNDTSITDLQQIVIEQRLVYNGYKNLPSSLSTTKFNINGGFAFSPNKLVSYTDTGSCEPLTDKTSYTKRVELLKGLQDSYSGTIVQNVGEIKNIVDLVINTTTPSQEVINYAGNFVNNNLGGSVEISGNGGGTGNQTQNCEDIITQQQVDTLNLLWSGSTDMDIYGSADWSVWLDPASGPLTKTQWCNDVHVIDTYTNGGVTADLALAYSAMNNLSELWYYGDDFLVKKNALAIIPHLQLAINGGYDESVFTLVNLEGLHLNGLNLTSIPSTIGNLTNLTTLYIPYNPLTTLPAEIWNLTNLKTLGLDNIQLSTLPSGIGNLTNLTTLTLSDNPLTVLPAEIWNLTNLKTLSLNNIQLSTLPSGIGNLTSLTRLYLNSNQLTTLPSQIGSLTNLTSLTLGSNMFSTIPLTILGLNNLTILHLYNNQLTSIPTQIGNLVNLKELFLANNGLLTLPTQIGNLVNLGTLALNGNTGLGNLSFFFSNSTPNRTQGGMTIGGNGTKIVISGSF